MEKFVKGDIVVVPFPFSDLSNSKRRPALVVANPVGDDIILAQITSKTHRNHYSIGLSGGFRKGKLPVDSYVKVNRIFSADQSIIEYAAGKLNLEKIREVEKKLVRLFTR